jgi:hypothetical protein
MKNFLLYLLLSAALIDNTYSAPTKKKNKKTSQRKKSGKSGKKGKSGRSGGGSSGAPVVALTAATAAGVAAGKAIEAESIAETDAELFKLITSPENIYDTMTAQQQEEFLANRAGKINKYKDKYSKTIIKEAQNWAGINTIIIERAKEMTKEVAKNYILYIQLSNTLTEKNKKAMEAIVKKLETDTLTKLNTLDKSTQEFIKDNQAWYEKIKRYEHMLYIEGGIAVAKKEHLKAIELIKLDQETQQALKGIFDSELFMTITQNIDRKKKDFEKQAKVLMQINHIKLFNSEIKNIDKKIQKDLLYEDILHYITRNSKNIATEIVARGTGITEQNAISEKFTKEINETVAKLDKAKEILIIRSEVEMTKILQGLYECILSETKYKLRQQTLIRLLKAKAIHDFANKKLKRNKNKETKETLEKTLKERITNTISMQMLLDKLEYTLKKEDNKRQKLKEYLYEYRINDSASSTTATTIYHQMIQTFLLALSSGRLNSYEGQMELLNNLKKFKQFNDKQEKKDLPGAKILLAILDILKKELEDIDDLFKKELQKDKSLQRKMQAKIYKKIEDELQKIKKDPRYKQMSLEEFGKDLLKQFISPSNKTEIDKPNNVIQNNNL